jgi:serine protease Do
MRTRVALLLAFVAGCLLTVLTLIALSPRLRASSGGVEGTAPIAPATPPSSPPMAGPTPRTDGGVGTPDLGDGPLAVRSAAARIAPAVVDIHIEGRAIQVPSPFSGDPFFRRFFGLPAPGTGDQEERIVPRGAGSGVIIRPDGTILTNAHVVDDAARIAVQIAGKSYDARVIGKDDDSDIAVVKIDPRGAKLPVAELGNSDDVRVGDWALAVGNPLDVGTSVTLGIISAIHRNVGDERHPLQSLIQTDAAINPGNSGGALANIQGQVIGIDEAIASPTGASVGIGFAVPINAAIRVADELIRHGKVVRPYLGIAYAPLSAIPPQAREQAGLPLTTDEGMVVERVYPGSPAETAGLRVNDVLLEANRQRITDAAPLNGVAQGLKVGDRLTLLVSREGRNRLLTMTLRERPAQFGSS